MSEIIMALTMLLPTPPMTPTLGIPTPTPVVYRSEMTQLPATGLATYYSTGVFDIVLRTRGLPADTCTSQGRKGCVAMLYEADQGREVCTEVNGEIYGPYIVADMASDRDRPGLIDDGWKIDIQQSVWLEMGFWDAPTMVTVTEDC